MQNRKVILIIMDGWGLGAVKDSDAIQHAHTPFVTHFIPDILTLL